MQITLPPDLEQFIQHQLNNGSFLSANEVIQEALRLFQRTLPQDMTTDRLKEALQMGMDDIAADRSTLYPNAIALATDIKQLARQQQQSRSSF
jgi:putative addiction module CopG family antidote